MCIFTWATKGLHLSINTSTVIDFDGIFKLIPLKWGAWIRSVLMMCLQTNPKLRTSAEELLKFLVLSKKNT